MPRPAGIPKTGGRKEGTPNKATATREAEIRASGVTPLDFMLGVMRDDAWGTLKPLARWTKVGHALVWIGGQLHLYLQQHIFCRGSTRCFSLPTALTTI